MLFIFILSYLYSLAPTQSIQNCYSFAQAHSQHPETTPLNNIFEAIRIGDIEVVKNHIQQENIPFDIPPINLIHHACVHNQPQVLQYLLSCFPDAPQLLYKYIFLDRLPVHFLATKNYPQCLLHVLDTAPSCVNITVHSSGLIPLHLATMNRSFECAEILLNRQAIINTPSQDDKQYTSLHQATLLDDLSYVKLFVSKGANLYAVSKKGLTPFHVACRAGSNTTVEFLYQSSKGDQVNRYSDEGLTPLHYACMNGHLDVVMTLIKNGANVDAPSRNDKQLTPLHATISTPYTLHPSQVDKRKAEICQALIQAGADLETKSASLGQTALHYACGHGFETVVRMLLDHGADIHSISTQDHSTPLQFASNYNQIHLIDLLLQNGADKTINHVSSTGLTALQLNYNRHFNLALIEKLVQANANVHVFSLQEKMTFLETIYTRYPSLFLLLVHKFLQGELPPIKSHHSSRCHYYTNKAIEYNDAQKLIRCIQWNLFCRTSPQQFSNFIHHAIEKNNFVAVELLLQYSKQFNLNKKSCCHFIFRACQIGHLEVIQKILDWDPDCLSYKNKEEQALFLIVCQFGHTSIAELFVQHNISLDTIDNRGWTALHYACHYNQTEMVLWLLKHGFSVDLIDYKGNTPLHHACLEKCTEIVKILLSNHANIHLFSDLGLHAIHYASIGGDPDIIQQLLDQGISVDFLSKGVAVTPFHLACEKGRTLAIQTLLKAGSKEINVQRRGFFPLHLIAQNGNKDLLLLFLNSLSSNTDINTLNEEKYTPLHYACRSGHNDIVKILLERGAHINSLNQEGLSPLHFAVIGQHENTISTLIEFNVEIDAYSRSGYTALHFAVQKENFSIVQMLLSAGANPLLPSKKEKFFIISYARDRGLSQIAQLIASYMHPSQSPPTYSPHYYQPQAHAIQPHFPSTYSPHYYQPQAHAIQPHFPSTYSPHGYQPQIHSMQPHFSSTYSPHGYQPQAHAIQLQPQCLLPVVPQQPITCVHPSYPLPLEQPTTLSFNPLFITPTTLNRSHHSSFQLNPNSQEFRSHNHSTTCPELPSPSIGSTLPQHAQNNPQTAPLQTVTKKQHRHKQPHKRNNPQTPSQPLKPKKVQDNPFPLHQAIRNEQNQLFFELLDQNKASLDTHNKEGCTALHIACQTGNNEAVQALLERGAYIDSRTQKNKRSSALLLAVENNHVQTVYLLLQYRCNINFQNRYQQTALHLACVSGYAPIVQMLLEYKKQQVDINLKDQYQSSPLMLASKYGHSQVVHMLLEYEGPQNQFFDINATNVTQHTALSFACIGGHKDIVRQLLEYKKQQVNVNHKDQQGSTPLMHASRNGYLKIVQMLLEYKKQQVDVNVRNYHGKTSLHWANNNQHHLISSLLLQYGARTKKESPLVPSQQPASCFTETPLLLALPQQTLFISA